MGNFFECARDKLRKKCTNVKLCYANSKNIRFFTHIEWEEKSFSVLKNYYSVRIVRERGVSSGVMFRKKNDSKLIGEL